MTPRGYVRPESICANRDIRQLVLILVSIFLLSLLPSGTAFAQSGEAGAISGQVFDAETGAPIENATVILAFPDPGDGSDARQEVATSGPAGDYEFGAIPAGVYSLSFIKSGFRASSMTDFEVVAGQDNVANFPMPRSEVTASGEILELDAYVVEASVVGEMMANLELRLESDQLVNLLSAEDLSKFAASDVADALKRVAGVNIVEGQFAIIRGLEDRYSSTLYNGAPVPSPDPESQSVQLDLFPSDIVGNLSVAKNFSPDSPSNSAGGSIDIITLEYPEELTFKFAAGTGFSDRALDTFRRYDQNSPVGTSVGSEDVIETDFSAMFGGRSELFGRELRFKVVGAHEVDYDTREGWQWTREPRRPVERRGRILESGGLSLGILNRPGGRFDLEDSTRKEQLTLYGAIGIDLDTEGDHRVDFSTFYTKKEDETVQLRANGYVPGFDYDRLLNDGDPDPNDYVREVADTWLFDWRPDDRGLNNGKQSYYAPTYASRSLDRERDLYVYQLNGEHDFARLVEGLEGSWVANYAETSQDEVLFETRYSFDSLTVPESIPSRPSDFPSGIFGTRSDIVYGENDIEENQYFGRADLAYEFEPVQNVVATLNAGFWFEQANRDVKSSFETLPSGDPSQPGVSTQSGGISTNFTVTGDNPQQMGRRIYQGAQLDDLGKPATSDGKREIRAWHGGIKLVLFEDLDLLAGVRIEDLRITSDNDPYTGFCGSVPVNPDGSCPPEAGNSVVENTFPTRFLMFDRLDNPDFEFPAPPGTVFNDQVLGITVTPDPEGVPCPGTPGVNCVDYRSRDRLNEVVNGEIDRRDYLPSASLAYRPWEGWVFRSAYSQTIARPSFRELGYYLSVDSASDDFTVGNPQLKTSEVWSVDGRVEWTFGDFGDLLAMSAFYKEIDDPIEAIIIRDPSNVDCTGVCQFRTFTNTPATAELWGLELEGRRTFDFLSELANGRLAGFFESISVGGNFTWIDAEVERNPFQRERFNTFFGITPEDQAAGLEKFSRYKKNRRLFNQPEWIANADITFDQQDWGTKITLSIFAISDVLDAAGGTQLDEGGVPVGLTLDRYTDEFYQLDLVASQAFSIPKVPGEFTGKVSIKNLTDTTRKVIYDTEQTNNDLAERSFKVGRDFSFSIGYTVPF